MIMVAAARTHPGFTRSSNEDAHLLLTERGLVAVADGMAGHRFGELAAAIAVKTLSRFYESAQLDAVLRENHARALKAQAVPEELSFQEFKVRRAAEEANAAILDTARRNPRYSSMGTTLVVLTVEGNRVCIGHAGDSRAYRWNRKGLFQLTEDHSLVNQIRQQGGTEEVSRCLVVRALGLDERMPIDTLELAADVGDVFLLCSDGLTDELSAARMEECFGRGDGPESWSRTLVELALEQGGNDNITALVVQLVEEN